MVYLIVEQMSNEASFETRLKHTFYPKMARVV